MRLGFLAYLASAVTAVLADHQVSLITESDNRALDGQDIIPYNEGAGFDLLFLNKTGVPFRYSDSDKGVYRVNNVTGTRFNFTLFPITNEVSIGVTGGPPIMFRMVIFR